MGAGGDRRRSDGPADPGAVQRGLTADWNQGRRHIVLTAMDDVGAQARAEYSILITTKPSETTVYENDLKRIKSDGAVLPAAALCTATESLFSADE